MIMGWIAKLCPLTLKVTQLGESQLRVGKHPRKCILDTTALGCEVGREEHGIWNTHQIHFWGVIHKVI